MNHNLKPYDEVREIIGNCDTFKEFTECWQDIDWMAFNGEYPSKEFALEEMREWWDEERSNYCPCGAEGIAWGGVCRDCV